MRFEYLNEVKCVRILMTKKPFYYKLSMEIKVEVGFWQKKLDKTTYTKNHWYLYYF